MTSVDLNCDIGESFGAWTLGADDDVLAQVSSANIACGFHAGDAATMRRTVDRALARGVALGAHPGLPDLAGFGRRAMEISPDEAYEMVVYQVGALAAFAAARGARLAHVKPHGALYNMAATRPTLADAIARAVHDVDAGLMLFALAGSALVIAARSVGITPIEEVFADRRYAADGTLVPRTHPGAVITDAAAAVTQAVRMVREGRVTAIDGTDVRVHAGTICIHGDTPGAAEHARALRAALDAAGVTIAAPTGARA
ncbi:MAG: 5-oxoprolinase subunit PxpA [Gemmatimonadaceae bacterium]